MHKKAATEGQTTDRPGIIQNLYLACAAGDGSKLGQLLADTHWVEAAGMPYGGTYRGFSEIAESVFGPLASNVKNFTAGAREIIPAGEDTVLAVGIYRGQGSASEVAVVFAHLWTVAGGKITNFVQYADTYVFRQATGT